MMKVYNCKLLNTAGFERKIRKVIARAVKQESHNLRIFCVTAEIQKSLEMAGIPSEILQDFNKFIGADDEPSWDKAFELSDELRSSIDDIASLKFFGINFLTMEYNMIKYVYAVKLSNLLKQMIAQHVDIVVIVLTPPHISWLADINTASINTIKHGRTIKSLLTTGLFINMAFEGYSILTDIKDWLQNLLKRRRISTWVKGNGKFKALFIVSYSIFARPAIAIVDACPENGITPYIVTDDRSILPQIRGHQARYRIKPPVSLTLLASLRYLGTFITLPFRLKKHINSFYRHHRLSGAVADEFSAAYLCRLTLLQELTQLCWMALSRILFLEKTIKDISPDILCVMPHERFLQQIGWDLMQQKYHRPVLACSSTWEINDSGSFRRHFHADKFAVFGEKIKDIFMGSGIDPLRIVVTGAAHYDRLFNRNREQDEHTLRGYGIEPEDRIALFAAQPSPFSEVEDMLSGIIGAVRNTEDMRLVVKVHPDDDIALYEMITGKYRDTKINVLKDIDLSVLISHCELLITKHSTTALEAMMVDKPVVTINLTGEPDPITYAQEGASLGVYHKDDIKPAILKALHDENTRRRLKAARLTFVRNWAGEPDGRASQRIISLMKEMIKHTSTT
jgi:glycosyltransferase involved in cell wall biosynthesis